MKKTLKTIMGIVAILLSLSLNLRYAFNDYGILDNTLSFHVMAQASASGNGGSDSGNGSNGESSDGMSTGGVPLFRREVREDCTITAWVFKQETQKYGWKELAGKQDACKGSWSYSCNSISCSPSE